MFFTTRGIRRLALACGMTWAVWGCDDSPNTGPETPPETDSKVVAPTTRPDAGAPARDSVEVDRPAVEINMGEGCVSEAECKPGSPSCVIFNRSRQLGICTRECTADDPDTPLVQEDDCPEGFGCSELQLSGRDVTICLKRCDPSFTQNGCPASSQQACHPASTRFATTNQAVCWYAACTSDEACPVWSNRTCVLNSDCSDLGTDAFCDPDQRQCARPGNCTAAGICGTHSLGNSEAQVGDPCQSDFDCPSNGTCLEEEASLSGSIGVGYRNGYCAIRYCIFDQGLADRACPNDATCHRLYYGGLCMRSCKLDDVDGCRGVEQDLAGDYECYNWPRFKINGIRVADSPLCEPASRRRCDTNKCASLGDRGNPTQMRCRDRFTGEDLPAQDPNGICLDDTVSGLFPQAPDAGPISPGGDGGVDAAP